MVNYKPNSITAPNLTNTQLSGTITAVRAFGDAITTINDLVNPCNPNTWYTTNTSGGSNPNTGYITITNGGNISFELADKNKKEVRDDTLTTLNDNFTLRYYKDGYQVGAPEFLPKVTDVQTYGDKVVKVVFADGTFTKAVKDDEDDFLTAGIAICYLKKMLASDDIKYGTNAFNKVISKIIKIMDKNRKAAEKKKKDEAAAKAKRLAKETKKNKKKIKRDKRK